MTDNRTKEQRSSTMSRIKNKNTNLELSVRRALFAKGFRYRIHSKKLPGRPDIAFVHSKVAIFLNGCFWHRCPYCNPKLPASNQIFWKKKFILNVERDQMNFVSLRALGWKVLVIWECQVKRDIDAVVSEIEEFIAKERTQ